MVIKPRAVSSGALKRWLIHAADLVGRQFHLWFAMSWLAALLLFQLGHIPGLAFMAGLVFFHWGMAIAAWSDRRRLTPARMILLLPGVMRGIVRFLREHPWLVVIILVFSSWQDFPDWLPHAKADAASGLESYPGWLSPPFLWMAGSALMLATMILGDAGGEAHILMLRGWYGIPREAAARLAREGVRKNRRAHAALGIGCATVAMASTFLLSWLVPLLLCLVPALFYVAFRDIFLHQDENGVIECSSVPDHIRPDPVP